MILRFINLISLIFLISTQHHSTYEFEKTLHLMLVVLIVSNVERTALRFVEREHVHWNRALRHVKAHVTRLISPRNIRRNIRTTRYFFFFFLSSSSPTIDYSSTPDYSFKKIVQCRSVNSICETRGDERREGFQRSFRVWGDFLIQVSRVGCGWFCRTSFASGIFVNYRGCISFWS